MREELSQSAERRRTAGLAFSGAREGTAVSLLSCVYRVSLVPRWDCCWTSQLERRRVATLVSPPHLDLLPAPSVAPLSTPVKVIEAYVSEGDRQ